MKLFTITYADGQPCPFTEYRNRATECLWRFENNAMIDIADNKLGQVFDWEMVGIFSHKFLAKTNRTAQSVEQAIHHNFPDNAIDLINFSPSYVLPIARKYNSFMDWSAAGHGEVLRDLIKACCEHIGFEYHNTSAHVVYANQFAARKAVYVDYIETVIKPCLELLEGPLWHLANQDSKYIGIGQPKLKELTGLDYYNYIPFVLERMTIQYIVNRNIKTISL